MLNIITFLLFAFLAGAQSKVANYSVGEDGTKEYEHFSFWVKDKHRARVTYSYDVDRKETTITYLGKTTYKNEPAFTVQFANHYILYIIPKGSQLQVFDSSGKYNKIFNWEYEGPVNGVGTFCDVCAEDEKEAAKLLRSFYLNDSNVHAL